MYRSLMCYVHVGLADLPGISTRGAFIIIISAMQKNIKATFAEFALWWYQHACNYINYGGKVTKVSDSENN